MLLILLDVRSLARNWLAGQRTVIRSPRLKHECENEGQREPEQDRRYCLSGQGDPRMASVRPLGELNRRKNLIRRLQRGNFLGGARLVFAPVVQGSG